MLKDNFETEEYFCTEGYCQRLSQVSGATSITHHLSILWEQFPPGTLVWLVWRLCQKSDKILVAQLSFQGVWVPWVFPPILSPLLPSPLFLFKTKQVSWIIAGSQYQITPKVSWIVCKSNPFVSIVPFYCILSPFWNQSIVLHSCSFCSKPFQRFGRIDLYCRVPCARPPAAPGEHGDPPPLSQDFDGKSISGAQALRATAQPHAPGQERCSALQSVRVPTSGVTFSLKFHQPQPILWPEINFASYLGRFNC